MIKCPFCHFENEDGALFCERCTSDLSSVAPTPAAKPAAPPPPPAIPAIPVAEAIPLAAEPIMAEAMPLDDNIPMATAEPVEALPLAAAEVQAIPFEASVSPAPAVPLAPLPPPAPAPLPEPMAFQPSAPPAPPPAPMPMPMPEPAPAPIPVAATPAPVPAPVPMPEVPAGTSLPPGSQPRLLVLRGQKRNVEYPVYEGLNFVGRADEKPVDIDLEEQEPPDRIWCSRQHACISFEENQLQIEDLNSANGTYVNRTRVYPGQKRPLAINDVIQIGNVQLKVLV
jgi:hypothetical protein